MNVLVACEFSGVVREAFTLKGHNAVSVDLLPSEKEGKHVIEDIRTYIENNPIWDIMIAFPPCTYLCRSGASHWKNLKPGLQENALELVRWLYELPIEKICIENPIGILSTRWKKPTQYIQPYQFGHGEKKKTCLWLKNLPPLVPTDIVDGRVPRVHYERPGVERWKNRSRTYTGIASAMAQQWG